LESSDEWQQRPFLAGTTNTALTLGTIKRSELGDISVFTKTRQASLAAGLTDTRLSPFESIKVGKLPTWRYTVTENINRGKQSAWTYMVTIYVGLDEVVIVNTWTLAANFELQQSEMHRIEDGISGIAPPV